MTDRIPLPDHRDPHATWTLDHAIEVFEAMEILTTYPPQLDRKTQASIIAVRDIVLEALRAQKRGEEDELENRMGHAANILQRGFRYGPYGEHLFLAQAEREYLEAFRREPTMLADWRERGFP